MASSSRPFALIELQKAYRAEVNNRLERIAGTLELTDGLMYKAGHVARFCARQGGGGTGRTAVTLHSADRPGNPDVPIEILPRDGLVGPRAAFRSLR